MVPTYSAGYPLAMASFARLAGPNAIFLIVPLAAGAIVWLTYLIGRDVMSPGATLIAVACTATSPVFLFESMQPMSDIPLTAWMLTAIAFARRRTASSALAAGAAASMAIVTRPNVAPLALAAGLFALGGWDEDRRRQLARLGIFFAASIPGMALVAAINDVLFGSPLSSGYGSLATIFRAGDAWRTAWQYIVWLLDTQSIFIFVALACPLLAIVRPGAMSPRLRAFWPRALTFVAVNFGCYVFYTRFDHWSFLRFLLPSIPVLFILAAAGTDALLSRRSDARRAGTLLFVLLLFPFAYVHSAGRGDAFVLRAGFRHVYEEAAEYAKARAPHNAVFLALTETGALRLYGNRMSLRFELIDPSQYHATLDYLRRQRLLPYAALQRYEVAEFETRFQFPRTTGAGAARALALPPDNAVLFVPLDVTAK
jgi:4-amino-4-deoxy-L-arabinose transferase-like glycosyltransferase